MKKLSGILLLCAFSSASFADTVRLSDGNSCSFDAGDTPWELGFTADHVDGSNSDSRNGYNPYDADRLSNEYRVGVELSYKFGGPERLDCSRLYNMQLQSKEAELKALQKKLEMMEASEGIKWD